MQHRQQERSPFEVLLPNGHKLWPDWLYTIDTLPDDEGVVEVVAQVLERRWPQSRRRGRPGTPAEAVIRMLILKHLVRRIGQRVRTASRQAQPALQRAPRRLQQIRPLVQRVLAQTRARVPGGDTHVPDKVLSVFESHTATIRNAKITEPTEFANWSRYYAVISSPRSS